MASTLVLRNVLSNDRQEVDVRPGQTVRDAVTDSGMIAAGNPFSVRDKNGQVVDDHPVEQFAGAVLSVGLTGDGVEGGSTGASSVH